jgi:hypothetical protein
MLYCCGSKQAKTGSIVPVRLFQNAGADVSVRSAENGVVEATPSAGPGLVSEC